MSKMSQKQTILGYVGKYCIESFTTLEDLKVDWETLQKEKTACIYQSYNWVRIACNTLEIKNTPLIITGKDGDGLQFVLPMVLEGKFIKTLRWIGGSHANICSGMYSDAFLKAADRNTIKDIFKLISTSLSGIVVAKLNNQPHELNARTNPLTYLTHQNSVNIMYDIDLTMGLDAILDVGNGKRKRKLWRKQQRVAETMGGYEFVIPKNDADIAAALEEFKTLKAARFKDLGIKDVFAQESSIKFLDEMAYEPMADGIHQFRIFQLKVGGTTRAMYAVGVFGNYCQAYVNAVKYDDFADQSPGEMVMYAMVKHLVGEGFTRLDMGVGNERYKRSWCPGQHELFDNILPMTPIAIPFNKALQLKNTAKRYLRNNDRIWSQIKKLRKIKASILPR